MTITAAADGSALGNPGPAGWAWYIDDDTWRAGGWPHGTNNMGELKAVLDLLEATAVDADQHLRILCDSQYVINSVTRWMPGWKRKGWRKKDGKPVLNVDLLKAIDAALAGRSVEFEWVRGHAGHRMNEAADERARAVATAYQKGTAPQVGPGYRGGPAPTAPTPAPSAATAGEGDLLSLLGDDPQTGPAIDPVADIAADEVATAELALLRDDVRSSREAAARLVHPHATEIGASGRAYDRQGILDLLGPLDPPAQPENLVTEQIAPGVMLVRWDDRRADRLVRRSSVWVRDGGRWLLRHHQGTPA
ncbi:ribonuclease HI family protein [Brachybacterium sp. EF45031]|uniref:ribonuclease HI family protein n=1 Tax=Brachybacterium sillae TaxID=2810536 RepID=UPI00217E10D9|nr:ribonuclease HI family protein [Brachybacterium sillae]MCS6711421.1 ribonuclease HI family protein [Brachybacterium sillae]